MQIVEFETQAEAYAALASIKAFAGDGCGFEVWDTAKESPQGSWYFFSTQDDSRVSGWPIPEGVTVRDMPPEWLPVE